MILNLDKLINPCPLCKEKDSIQVIFNACQDMMLDVGEASFVIKIGCLECGLQIKRKFYGSIENKQFEDKCINSVIKSWNKLY